MKKIDCLIKFQTFPYVENIKWSKSGIGRNYRILVSPIVDTAITLVYEKQGLRTGKFFLRNRLIITPVSLVTFLSHACFRILIKMLTLMSPNIISKIYKKVGSVQNQSFIRCKKTKLILFLILTFAGSTIRNSSASPLAAATPTIQELVLFKGSYISRLYGSRIYLLGHFSKKLSPIFVEIEHEQTLKI